MLFRGAKDLSCHYVHAVVGNKEGVAGVSGKLKSLRSQLVFLQGELDQALVLVYEDLGSFGLKDAKSDKGKTQFASLTPLEGPNPENKALSFFKRNKVPLVKHAFLMKPNCKWAKRARVGESPLMDFDPFVDMGRNSSDMSTLSDAQVRGSLVDLP